MQAVDASVLDASVLELGVELVEQNCCKGAPKKRSVSTSMDGKGMSGPGGRSFAVLPAMVNFLFSYRAKNKPFGQ